MEFVIEVVIQSVYLKFIEGTTYKIGSQLMYNLQHLKNEANVRHAPHNAIVNNSTSL